MDEIGKLKQKEVIIVEHIFTSSHIMWRLEWRIKNLNDLHKTFQEHYLNDYFV